jgi:flagellar protein FliO/FliZ
MAGTSSAAATSASPQNEEGPKQWLHGDDINWSRQIITTIGGLLLMCGAIVLVLRFMYGRMGMPAFGGGQRNLQVLDRHVLGPNRALLLVQVPGKILLLGMTEHQITMLSDIAPDELETALPPRPPYKGRPTEKAPAFEAPPPDNLVDLAGLFGRRSQASKEESE